MDLGPTLRAAREKQGITLDKAEQETKIRKKYLKALEEENFDILPGSVYARGFLRNYARFLGLNAEDLVKQYKESQLHEEVEEQNEPVAEPVGQGRKKSYLLPVIWGLLLIAAAVIFFSGLLGDGGESGGISQKKQGAVDIGDVPGDTPKRQGTGSGEEAPGEPRQEVEQSGVQVNLAANRRCWLRVLVDGKIVFEGFIVSGEEKQYNGKDNVRVRLGDAGAVRLTVNGQDLGYLGAKGEVVERVFRSD